MYEFAIKKMKQEESKIRKRSDKTFDEVQIGDYFYADAGYNMSLVTYYKVVDKRGKATLEVIRVGNRYVSGGNGMGDVVPDDSNVEGGPFKVRCTTTGGSGVSFLEPEYGWAGVRAYPWDGRPLYYNDYD